MRDARKQTGSGAWKRTVLFGALAAACVAVAAMLWLQSPEPPEQATMAAAPQAEEQPEKAEESPDTSVEMAQNAADVAEESATPAAQAMQPTKLNLTLKGTQTGSRPLAIIVTPDGLERSYTEGSEIMDGVVLLEVQQRRILVDNHGTVETITITGGSGEDNLNISGLWEAVVLQEGRSDQGDKIGTFNIAHTGTTLSISGEGMPVLQGTIIGNHIEVAVDQGQIAAGDLNADRTQMILKTQDPRGGQAYSLKLTKLPADVAAEQMRLAKIAQERNSELAAIGEALRGAADKYGTFPSTLKAVAPEFIDATAVADQDGRNLTYLGAAVPTDRPSINFSDFRPDLAMPDRLMAYERALKSAYGGRQIPGPQPVLKAVYDDPPMEFTVLSDGRVHQAEEFDESGPSTAQQAAAMRASSQNNMKQLGLVIKMFENEHDGYIPGGWLTVYPEYLTDPNVLTSPVDTPGNLSYRLLFPAIHLSGYVQELEQQRPDLFPSLSQQLQQLGQGNAGQATLPQSAYDAIGQSEMPLVIETVQHTIPGGGSGRNVLFSDGHVVFFRESEFQQRIGPWLSLAR